MGTRTWIFYLAVAVTMALLPDTAQAAQRGRGRTPEIWQTRTATDDYGRGYREGVQRGEDDSRTGRPFNTAAGNDRSRYGNGFSDGYRTGYDRQHALTPYRPRATGRVAYQPVQRSHQEPAYAAGYEDGYGRGLSDGGEGHRYDPVRHAEYRDAERGYRDGYGSRDAYRTNYRTGFRQGYEEGYRLGTRTRK